MKYRAPENEINKSCRSRRSYYENYQAKGSGFKNLVRFFKRLLCYCKMNDSGNFLCSKGSTINNSKAVCPFVFMLFVFVCKMCFKCSFRASLFTFTRALITSSYYFMKHQKYFQLLSLCSEN